MSENQDEKMRKLREEVNALKEQLIRISEELESKEPVGPEKEEPIQIDIEEELKQDEPEPVLGAISELEAEHETESEPGQERENERRYYRGLRPDRYFKPRFMSELGNYIEDFVEDVLEGVSAGIEESLRIHPYRGPHTKRRLRPHPRRRLGEEEAKSTADAMSALANEHRVKILEELSYGGLYASDFQERLPEISASTLSSHLDVLEKAGLIVQERRRGRYVISLAGRLAVKMAFQINRLAGDARNSSKDEYDE